MNLGIIGYDLSIIGPPDSIIWLRSELRAIFERSKAKAVFTYDGIGTPVIAREVAPETVTRVVLTSVNYKVCKPLFSDLVIVDDDMLPWVDYVVIVSSGQPDSFMEKHRINKVLELNYLAKGKEWVTYG